MRTRYTIELLCDISGTKVGEAKVSEPMTLDQYRKKTNLVDLRCDSCVSEHGSFKEMVETYTRKTGRSYRTAENFVKKNRKLAEFEASLANL